MREPAMNPRPLELGSPDPSDRRKFRAALLLRAAIKTRPGSWIDAPASLPVELIEVALPPDMMNASSLALLRFLRMFRLVRLLRLLKIATYVTRLEELLEVGLRASRLTPSPPVPTEFCAPTAAN